MSDCRCTKYVGKEPCIHDLQAIIEEQAEAIARVRDLHKQVEDREWRHAVGCPAAEPWRWIAKRPCLPECHEMTWTFCKGCPHHPDYGRESWPCDTIKALDGELDTPCTLVSTLTANADIAETSANADTDCQNSNETVAESSSDGEHE